MRGISGGKRTSFSYGQELAKARHIVGQTLNDGNEILIRYVKVVAKLRARGNDLFIARIKRISDLVKVRESKEKIRMINLHFFYNLDSSGAERFIKGFENPKRRNNAA